MTEAGFNRLLAVLDPDREQAGEVYLRIRDKLMNFFRWRGCATPEDHADETIDRVARRLEEGSAMQAGNPYLYFHGVAVNVLREHWKREQRHPVRPLDELPLGSTPAVDPLEEQNRRDEAAAAEVRGGCLDGCVNGLPAAKLNIVTQYHQGQGGARIAARQRLAEELGIPLNALRIRAFRIREELEVCVSACVKRETNLGRSH